jgi:hypothetical protein
MNASPFWIMLLLSSGADERGMIDRARYVRTKFSKSFAPLVAMTA